MTVREVLILARSSIAPRDSELLLGYVLGRDRVWLMAHAEAGVSAGQQSEFARLVERRAQHEPLQYIVGAQEFFGLQLRVTPAVLIPRPETELLVEAVLDWARTQAGLLQIVDIGTGSGAIALALAANLERAEITSVDISEDALGVARENAAYLGLVKRVKFLQGDLLEGAGLRGSVDVVVSNPPYVPAGDVTDMQRDVADYEPHLALFAGEDGLDIYRRLIPQSRLALRQGGLLAMEIGFGQSNALRELLRDWHEVRFIRDYAGIERHVVAIRP